MFVAMNAPIPPEFEAEAVTGVRLSCLKHVDEVRALVDPALAEIERGEVVDGDAFMRELIAETRIIHGG